MSVFGSYTSASRKAVLPVFEKRNNLYFYPTLYEGRECSKNVIYTGAVPNQQQDDFVPWLVEKFGKRWYLIGSNYIYPKEENNYCKKLLSFRKICSKLNRFERENYCVAILKRIFATKR